MSGLLYRLKYSANALLCVQLVPPYTGGSCRLEHSPANGEQGRGRKGGGVRARCVVRVRGVAENNHTLSSKRLTLVQFGSWLANGLP